MDKKEANLCFHFSERLKSSLFLLSGALTGLEGMKGERLEGGKEVAKLVLGALRNELGFAARLLPQVEVNSINKKLLEMEGDLEFHDYSKAREDLAKTLSTVTTLSNKYITTLMEEGLI